MDRKGDPKKGERTWVFGDSDPTDGIWWKDEILHAVLRGIGRESETSAMAAVGLMDVQIFHSAADTLKYKWKQEYSRRLEQGFELEYFDRLGIKLVATIESHCWSDDYEVFHGSWQEEQRFILDISPLLSRLQAESSFTSYSEWWGKAIEWVTRDPKSLLRVDELDIDVGGDHLHDVADDLRRAIARLDVTGDEKCMEETDRRMTKAYRDLSTVMTQKLRESDGMKEYDQQTSQFQLYLMSWFSLMLRDSEDLSGLAKSVVSGEERLPTLEEVMQEVEIDDDDYVWNLGDTYKQRLDRFEELLRSSKFQRIMREAKGDADLMQTAFLGIDNETYRPYVSPDP